MRKRVVLGLVVAAWLCGGLVTANRTDGDPIQRAIAWLHTQQLPDGSFGFRNPDGSAIPNASITADVVYVLALAGEDPSGAAWTPPQSGRSALDALAALAPTYVYDDAGQAGKVLRAVALAHGDPRSFGGLDLVGIIQAAYDPGTGRYHPALLYRHTLAMEGLLRAGQPVPAAAFDALFRAQLPDGGWFWSFDAARSDVDSTGRVLQLLAGWAGAQCNAGCSHAVQYLADARTAAGGGGASTRRPIPTLPTQTPQRSPSPA